MTNLSDQTPRNNNLSVAAKREIFRERCEARALLWCSGQLSLHDAVDVLQRDAVSSGLVSQIGQDEVQRIMAHAFEARRIRA